MSQATGWIRVIKVPGGESPQWVQKAWIGLILPCHPQLGFLPKPARGVVSNKRVELKGQWVSVPQDMAIAILKNKNLRAANWWGEKGYPVRGACFGFPEEAIEIVSGVTHLNIVHVPPEMMSDPHR